MDLDQSIDFKVGTGEIYNLNVWPNNGGVKFIFCFFQTDGTLGQRTKHFPVNINGVEFSIFDAAPELEPKDLKITINGKEVKIISCQKYYETAYFRAWEFLLIWFRCVVKA